MINDLTSSNTLSSMWKFADDTMVSEIVPKFGASVLQDTVHDVFRWSNDNRFKLNSLKCKELRIDFRRENNFKHDVYGRRQTAKVNSNFLFFSCNPYINHTKIKCLLLFTANTNTLILLHRELKTDGKSFIFAVCRLP